VAAAVVHGSSTKSIRLPDHESIYTAEISALLLALKHIHRHQHFVIFSDSLSSLQALSSFKIDNKLVLKITLEYTSLTGCGKTTIFCWVPAHVGIRGNEEADTAAEAGLQLTVSNSTRIAATGYTANVSNYVTTSGRHLGTSKLRINYTALHLL